MLSPLQLSLSPSSTQQPPQHLPINHDEIHPRRHRRACAGHCRLCRWKVLHPPGSRQPGLLPGQRLLGQLLYPEQRCQQRSRMRRYARVPRRPTNRFASLRCRQLAAVLPVGWFLVLLHLDLTMREETRASRRH